MDVLIFGGQSNMQGQTESLPPGEPVAGAFEYRHREGILVPLAHPVGEDFGDLLLGAHEGHGSLLPAFCRAYREVCKETVVAVHAAKGATTRADWSPSGKRYAFACEKIRAGLRAAAEREKIRKVFYIWLQGESDALAGTGETAYLSMLAAYKNALLRDPPRSVRDHPRGIFHGGTRARSRRDARAGARGKRRRRFSDADARLRRIILRRRLFKSPGRRAL